MCIDSPDASSAGPVCLVGPEATAAVLGIIGALVAITGTAAVFLVQTTGERYSIRVAPWRLVTRRAAIAFVILTALFACVAVIAIFDFRRVWDLSVFQSGLRADWGLVAILGLALAATAFVLVEVPHMLHPEALVASLVEPLFRDDADLERSRRVLGPARDVAAAALARSDLETWSFLVGQVREGIAGNVLLWDGAEGQHPQSRIFTHEVRSFIQFLTEATTKYGHRSAVEDVVRLVAHLLGFSVMWEAQLPSSEFVMHAVRLVRRTLDTQMYDEACELTRALAESSSRDDAKPYAYSMTALKQVGDWIVQEQPVRNTYLEVVYYQDPFSCLVQSLSDALDRIEEAPSYEIISEIQLVCEVTLARSWESRPCDQIQELAYLLKRSAVLAAEQSGEYGHLLLLPIHNLHETYEALMKKGCAEIAGQVVEKIAEIAANGFRPGLKSQIGPFPGRRGVEILVKCDRQMAIDAVREIYTRGHYQDIPTQARNRFVRMAQERLNDLLGFVTLIEVDDSAEDSDPPVRHD